MLLICILRYHAMMHRVECYSLLSIMGFFVLYWFHAVLVVWTLLFLAASISYSKFMSYSVVAFYCFKIVFEYLCRISCWDLQLHLWKLPVQLPLWKKRKMMSVHQAGLVDGWTGCPLACLVLVEQMSLVNFRVLFLMKLSRYFFYFYVLLGNAVYSNWLMSNYTGYLWGHKVPSCTFIHCGCCWHWWNVSICG